MTRLTSTETLISTLLTSVLLLSGCEALVGEPGSATNNQAGQTPTIPDITTINEGPFTILMADRQLVFEWDPVPNATGYNLYMASEPFADPQLYALYRDSELHLDVTSPYAVANLINHRYATYLFTAEVEGQEIPLGHPMDLYSSGAEPTDREVRMLELVNRARSDPEAEATRYNIDLNEGLAPGTISSSSKAPLAFNIPLMQASRDHSGWMLDTNTLDHTGAGGSNVGDRADAAGYVLNAPGGLGENLAWLGTTAPTINLTSAVENHHQGLFLSEGHRTNLLHEHFREVGVGQGQGPFTLDGTTYNSSIVTYKFGYSGNRYFLTGVAFDAANANDLYLPGTALDDVQIQVGDYRYAPFASGAFSVLLAPGSYEFAVSVSGQPVGIPEMITITNQNIKRDVVRHSGNIQIRTH